MAILPLPRAATAGALAGLLMAALAGSPAPTVSRSHASHSHAHRLDLRSVPASFARQSTGGAVPHAGRAVAFHPSGRAPSAAARRAAPAFALHPTNHNAIEPTLGVDRRGRAFLIATDAAEWPMFPSDALRSTDHGKTWDVVTPSAGGQRLHRNSSDPYLHVDEDTGRVFMADYLPVCTDLSFTDDGGESWTSTRALCGLGDHQTMFTGRPTTSSTIGYENVVYYCAIDGFTVAAAAASCAKSLDGGLTFVRTGEPPFSDPGPQGPGFLFDGQCLGLIGHGTTGPDGTVYVPRNWCGQPFVAISKDEGLSWDRVQVSDIGVASGGANLDHDSAVAVDRDGNVFYSWAGPDGLPYLSVSRDGGRTWTKPFEIGPPGLKTATLIALDATGRGKVALAYYGSTHNGHGEGAWDGYVMLLPDALSNDPLVYSARLNPPDDPLEGWCDTATCRAAREFVDVAIAPDGGVWAPFIDACFGGVCDQGGLDAGVAYTPAIGEAVVGRLAPPR
ncbi:MAG: glycoside hydrolase [Actinomycetota bacterium]|nr:glycoside hydrolase [Actinomycetota bacterium]